ncbi:hypothetical protein ACFV8E_32530 [Streptomyces sp. NPDC059849]|uniref:LexA family protein n=1 Tax=Streptomyces sp. NPDC059849 TaxID=3346969 RepID=UPI0036500D67
MVDGRHLPCLVTGEGCRVTALRRCLLDLSARQDSILATIRDWIVETGESPSARQMGERVGLSSTSASPAGSAASKPGD